MFAGSYRLRAFDEASRMRSISGSRAVAHRANPYSPPNMSSPGVSGPMRATAERSGSATLPLPSSFMASVCVAPVLSTIVNG